MNLNVAEYSDKLSNLCAIYGVKRLELFGSALRSDFDRENSDLDFLIEDALLRSAVERQFEIVGEALNRLKKIEPGVVVGISDY